MPVFWESIPCRAPHSVMGPVSIPTLTPSTSSPREQGLVQTRVWEGLGVGVQREGAGCHMKEKASGTREHT